MQVMGCAVALSFVVGGGSLWSGYAQVQADKAQQHHEQVQQRQAGRLLERKLCTTFGKLAARKPPAGDPVKNPSRAYEQWQHDTLVQLGTDLGCKP